MNAFWQLDHLTDEQVLDGAKRTLALGRKLTAELVAHLAEVEERRLHLHAACPSMFDYCVNRLGMSEDEACRRIDVARLARRFPSLYPALADGGLSLSVIALLKPHLGDENHAQLVSACRGMSVARVREVLAARSPQADVPSTVRKLPEARREPLSESPPRMRPPASAPANISEHDDHRGSSIPMSSLKLEPPRPPRPIEPIAPARYKIQLTASAELKQKLEQCRDLMRHANPSGDFAPIIERALELLLEKLMRERFGDSRRPRGSEECRCEQAHRSRDAPSRSQSRRPALRVDRSRRRALLGHWLARARSRGAAGQGRIIGAGERASTVQGAQSLVGGAGVRARQDRAGDRRTARACTSLNSQHRERQP